MSHPQGLAVFTNLDYSNEATILEAIPQLAYEIGMGHLNGAFQLSDGRGTRLVQNGFSQPIPGSPNKSLNETSTMPTLSVQWALGLAAYLKYREPSDSCTKSLQPYVQRSCVGNDIDTSQSLEGHYVSFGSDHPDVNGLIPLSSVPLDTEDEPPDSNSTSNTFTISTANETMAWYEVPQTGSNYSLLVTYVNNWIPSVLTACTISATWVRASTNLTGDYLYTPVQSTPENGGWPESASQTIQISPDRATKVMELSLNASENLNGLFSTTPLYSLTPYIMALALSDVTQYHATPEDVTTFGKTIEGPRQGSSLSDDQYDAMSKYLEKSGYRQRYKYIHVVSDGNWTDPALLARFSIQDYYQGYGYNSSTVPVRLSIVILCIYSLFAIIFIAYTLLSGQSASSWNSIGEVVMLALNSKQPEHLYDVSVGVETLSTYREPINIRTNKDKSAEMVVLNNPGFKNSEYSVVEPNVRY